MKNICKEKLISVVKNICIKCCGCHLSIITHHSQQNVVMEYYCVLYVYQTSTYSSYENHSGLINIVSASAKVFLILCPGKVIGGPSYYD